METGGAMSAKKHQTKCGQRWKQWRFQSGELSLLQAALNCWCLRNGYPAEPSLEEVVRADFAARHRRRKVAA